MQAKTMARIEDKSNQILHPGRVDASVFAENRRNRTQGEREALLRRTILPFSCDAMRRCKKLCKKERHRIFYSIRRISPRIKYSPTRKKSSAIKFRKKL